MKPPKGVTPRRPHGPRCVADWEIHPDDQAGHLRIRLIGPAGDDPARVEIRTGPSTFGPDLTTGAAVRRLAWQLLDVLQGLAEQLEAEPTPPDPQTTLYDHLAELTTQEA